ncbi:hypothetical protein JM93_02458 [Roseibium hamelinense]|uniref:Uncharacterized protein n=1 Tax=Roseibium hamelinense TaxID=150831 RepID=A0A562T213_9HYPH|nr:hypothetical protein [Roseibium hamelinense]MTI44592.1 hypothetical protein [Roseibium hamelinense]TWI87218.1 hypothetical protein JM93_02458 [Roseibium hamelinense]
MRILSLTLAVIATSAFAIAPASACSWMKSAESEKITVATAPTADDSNVSIATNDLSVETIKEMAIMPEAAEAPAE